jgi:hypothetical protein
LRVNRATTRVAPTVEGIDTADGISAQHRPEGVADPGPCQCRFGPGAFDGIFFLAALRCAFFRIVIRVGYGAFQFSLQGKAIFFRQSIQAGDFLVDFFLDLAQPGVAFFHMGDR